MNLLLILLGKLISNFSNLLNLGNGSTWPGHIALKINKNFLRSYLFDKELKIIFVIGTNGKTTTSKLLQTILEQNNIKTIVNVSGANLLNGIVSSLIANSNISGKLSAKIAIFEIDENALPEISKDIEPDYLIALNIFRDQLDRYGEINSIIKKWNQTIKSYKKTILLLNGDDPQIAYLGTNTKLKKYYFGLEDNLSKSKQMNQSADSILCPKCDNTLKFDLIYFSHLGKWKCTECSYKRPDLNINKFSFYPLEGTYIKYDTLAAVLYGKITGLSNSQIESSLKKFTPAFGRQEEINFRGKKIRIFLSKNPTSFNESLSTIKDLHGKSLIFALNDRIPDGLDISWIWDIDFEGLLDKDMNIFVCGDRALDMSLRLKYAESFNQVFNDFYTGFLKILENLDKDEVLYILPNYSAMLEIRKILTGKKIL